MSGSSGAEFVLVRRRDLERLTTEVMQMRDFLPKILNSDMTIRLQRLEEAERALDWKEKDCEHIRARLEASQGECLRTREENLSLLLRLSSMADHMSQQSECSSHMTSLLCTLLWSVSSREEAVRSILGLNCCAEFLMSVSRSLVGFVDGLGEKPGDEDNADGSYVLGLAGIITNVVAVACGRDFLISSCRDLMECWIHILRKIRLGTCNRLRVLLMKSLYNVSISHNGLLWMSQVPGFLGDLHRLLIDPDAEVCLHALLLVQSVVGDSEVLGSLWGEVQECLPTIIELSSSPNPHLQRTAKELLEEVGGAAH